MAVTILVRRRTYWALFIVSCLCALIALGLTVLLPGDRAAQNLLVDSDAFRVYSVLGLSISSLLLATLGVLLGALFAVAALATVLGSFRKTVSPEVFFFALWIASVALEIFRPLGFFLASRGAPISTQLFLAKLQLLMRYAGALALFVSGLQAAGLRADKPVTFLGLISGVSLALASLMPINSGIWSPSLMLQSGYSFLNEGLYVVVAALTVLNYMVAVRVRSDKTFLWTGISAALCLAGARLLARQTQPYSILVAIVLMSLGAWIFISKMHNYYIWQ